MYRLKIVPWVIGNDYASYAPVVLDGETLPKQSYILRFDRPGGNASIRIKPEAARERDLCKAISFHDIAPNIGYIEIEIDVGNPNFRLLAGFVAEKEYSRSFAPHKISLEVKVTGTFIFILAPELEEWKKPWSIKEFEDVCNTLSPQYLSDVTVSPGFQTMTFSFPVDTPSTLSNEVDIRFKKLVNLISTIEDRLQQSINENSLITYFNFPEEIRESCEQYLLYFVRFLKNVGVEADAAIEHESGKAGQVLFKVTPKSGKQALDKVRQALNIYLQLAEVRDMGDNPAKSIEVLRLEAQISHFQSQRSLALAEIQYKDSIIENKEELIAQLKDHVFFLHSILQAPTPKDDKKSKDVMGGMLTIGQLDTKLGVKLNLAQIMDKTRDLMLEPDPKKTPPQLPPPDSP